MCIRDRILLDQNYDGNVVLAFVIAMAIGALLGAVKMCIRDRWKQTSL